MYKRSNSDCGSIDLTESTQAIYTIYVDSFETIGMRKANLLLSSKYNIGSAVYTENTYSDPYFAYGSTVKIYCAHNQGALNEPNCESGAVCSHCGIAYTNRDTSNHTMTTYLYYDNKDNATHTRIHECCNLGGEGSIEAHSYVTDAYGVSRCEYCGASGCAHKDDDADHVCDMGCGETVYTVGCSEDGFPHCMEYFGGIYTEGSLVEARLEAEEGYKWFPELTTATWSGGELEVTASAEGKACFIMPAGDVTLYTEMSSYWPVYVYVPENGTITASRGLVSVSRGTGDTSGGGIDAYEGALITLTVTPDKGYELDTLTVMHGNEEIALVDGSFTMPGELVEIFATFKLHTHNTDGAVTYEKLSDSLHIKMTYCLNCPEGHFAGATESHNLVYDVQDYTHTQICTICDYEEETVGHGYTNGFCNTCGGYQPAVLNEDAESEYYGYYEISNGGQLFWLAKKINEGTIASDCNVILTQDINLESRVWTPIGYHISDDDNVHFTGIFNGNGKTVKGLNIQAAGTNQGFFGTLDGTVKDFTVYGEITITAEAKNVGVVGELTGTVSGITSHVTITVADDVTEACAYIGGIAGTLKGGTVENSAYYGRINIKAISVDQTGGIVGYVEYKNGGSINNCGFYGRITTAYTGSLSIGGIIGYSRSGKLSMTNCLSVGTITAEGNASGVLTTAHTAFGVINAAPKTVSNLYYLEGSVPQGTTNIDYDYTFPADIILAVTEEQLQSGEIAYKLGSPFGQDIKTEDTDEEYDAYPTLGGKTVRYGYLSCIDTAMTYTNDESADTDKEALHIERTAATCTALAICSVCEKEYGELHAENHASEDHTNGFYSCCGGYQSAVLTTDKYDIDGDGEKDEVYEISNAGQLYWFAAVVNSGYGDTVRNRLINAVLTADIRVPVTVGQDAESNIPDWIPIGYNENDYFGGHFDGAGHTVSGLYMNHQEYNGGLIGAANPDVIVENVGVIDSEFNVIIGGGVVGQLAGVIRNCYSTATVNAIEYQGACVAGGIVSMSLAGKIENCYSACQLSGNSADPVIGGIVGYHLALAELTVINSYWEGSFSAVGKCDEEKLLILDDLSASKTAEQFASGEVAYLLGSAFGQDIKTDDTDEEYGAYPVLGGKTVYFGYFSCANNAVAVYSNSEDINKEKPSHSYSTVWSKDETRHWHECICGEKTDEAAHSFGEWTVTKEATETEAGAKKRVCECGAEETEAIPALGKNGLSGGQIAGIVIGSIAVAGLGGFAIFWFVIKKKKWSDLFHR